MFERPDGKYLRSKVLKLWMDVPHQHYLELKGEFSEIKISMCPFPESRALFENSEFQKLLSEFPKLRLRQLTLKHDRVEVISTYEGVFPEELDDWFRWLTLILKSRPGTAQHSFLIKLDRYSEYAWLGLGLILPLHHYPTLVPGLTLTGLIVVLICFFLPRRTLLLRVISKLLFTLFLFIVVQLVAFKMNS